MFASKDIFLKSSGGYQISRSVRLRQSASAYFSRTNTNAPTNAKIGTLSMWLKRGSLATGNSQYLVETGTGTSNNTHFTLFFQTDNTLAAGQYSETPFTNTAVFRDPAAWYHLVITYDSTQATASNRFKLYINNQLFTSSTTITQNNEWAILQASQLINIGRHTSVGRHFDGYLTEINLIDGQALTPSSFGETNAVTGVWQPKKYTGTYGTNGFYLNFSDNSGVTATTIGKDYSGNGNNWTPSAGISITAGATYDSMLDVPTLYADGGNGRGNYAVLNPLDNIGGATFSNGNLQIVTGNAGVFGGRSTISVSSGKWYWEMTPTSNVAGAECAIGIDSATTPITSSGTGLGYSATSYSMRNNGQKVNNSTASAYGSSYTDNDVIGVALDLDTGTLAYYKNGVAQGTAFSGISGTFTPAMSDLSGAQGVTLVANFGQRPFTYTPPTGFKALNTQNLPTPTISNGAQYMAATTYTGTGSAMSVSNAVNNVSFQPDWVWIKQRNNIANHVLADAIRGVDKYVFSNLTNAEATATAGTGITAFNSNGFSLGTETSTVGSVNAAGGTGTYVAWNWNAGGNTVSNTNGSITSSVRANPTAGFSVVTYTGTGANATVGHGLNATPAMIIVKNRDSGAIGGAVYHTSMGATKYLKLFQTTTGSDNEATDNTAWNGGSPTFNSSVFSVGSLNRTNSSQQMVAYCFAAVAGYSAFGKYTGNGVPDGPFVYLGFRPRWLMTKRTDSTGSWLVVDSARNTYNVVNGYLVPNTSDAEGSATWGDFTANGFKLRGTTHNGSGESYIYAAFAENPFKYSLAR